jgi:hypothetical protein
MSDSPDLHDQADDEPDDLEQQLTAAFGPAGGWWVGELPGLGLVRLPLP